MKRRTFLAGVGGAVGAGARSAAIGPEAEAAQPGGIPRRVMGRTGFAVSVVGFPGLALRNHDQQECTAKVRQAFEHGVNYFDVAPAYGRDGECEIKLGVALDGIPRDRCFLSSKTRLDDAQGARRELERSLRRLKTDYLDLYQLHCLERVDEVQQALGGGGAMEVILRAKETGMVRNIGFSAHTTEAALAALNGFAFDTCMFPINFVEQFQTGFGPEVLERAREKGAAVIAIKPNSRGLWPKGVEKTIPWWYRPIENPDEMRRAMRWVLSQPGVVTGLPSSWFSVFDMTLDAVRDLKPVSDQETRALRQLASRCEPIFQRDKRKAGPVSPHDRRVA